MNKSFPRIVSLLPAATEIVCALGLEHTLIGRSHECDYPASIQTLSVCSEAKFIPGSGSLEIDGQVKDILSQALSIYNIDRELLKTLNPDVIITQTLCDVCAVGLKDVEAALVGLLNKDTEIISLEPNTLADIFTDITRLAAQLGVPDTGEQLLENLNERLDIISHKLKYISTKPTVACIEWLEPLMLSGNWMPQLVDIAGGQSVLTQNGKHSPYVNWDELQEQDPEIIIVMPCGFSIERTLKEIDVLLALPGFAYLQAVKNNKLYIADGNQYFNRSSPRIVDSVEILAEIINPKQFIFGYEGQGWMKFGV